jgi:beta-lactamase regulating signal transducer with metallopeptidase domain
LISSNEQVTPDAISLVHFTKSVEPVQTESNYLAGLLSAITLTLQHYLPMIVICWGVGTILFTIRLFGGWVTVRRLKTSAIAVEGEWNERMQQLVHKLDIKQFIELAESATVQAPLVIGYFKPVVLIPLGMIGGLSTEQLESIIIHELIHIRRHDYLVNLLQSLLEAVLFFNPFVWIISNIIRREREHCCDDAVIALHGNRLAYAHALTALEEARLSRAGLALSLAEDKNQLLNRIKRIMEKSVKPYSLRQRIVPVILVMTGLICASWLTINSRTSDGQQSKPVIVVDNLTTSQDTTIRIEKSGRYYKKSITTIDEDGKPHEEIVEEFDGYEPFAPLLAPMDFELTIPALDAISPIDAIPPVDMLLAIPAFPDFKLELNMTDTVPFPEGFHDMQSEFEEFSREFETVFKEKFGCEVKVNEEPQFDIYSMEEWAKEMDVLALKTRLIQLRQGETLAQLDQQMQNFNEEMGQWAENNARAFEELERRQMEQLESTFKAMEVPSFDFVKDLRPQLVKDGYLKEDEEIKSIEINNEVIKVNGKTIKESDRKKYKAIIDKNSFGPKLRPRPGRME